MDKTKKIFVALFLAGLTTFCFAGCGASTDVLQKEAQIKDRDKKIELEKEFVANSMGTLYTLREAYDNGYLTKSELMSIAYYKNGGRLHNEEIMDEAYSPAPKTPEVLSEETELLIKRAAAKDYRDNYDITEAAASGFTITKYYGTYGDCVAVMMQDEYSGYTCATWIDTIAGINIFYGDGNPIQIWRGINEKAS